VYQVTGTVLASLDPQTVIIIIIIIIIIISHALLIRLLTTSSSNIYIYYDEARVVFSLVPRHHTDSG
jgi:hypothetical protein